MGNDSGLYALSEEHEAIREAVRDIAEREIAPHAAEVDAESPDVVFVARRAGPPGNRRTVVGIDLGGGARHRRGARVASGPAPLRETLAAQLIMLSRWDARTEPLVDRPQQEHLQLAAVQRVLRAGVPGRDAAVRDVSSRSSRTAASGAISCVTRQWPVSSARRRSGWRSASRA